MKKSELKKLIKEAAKDLNLYSKPSYVGKLSEKQLKLLQEQDGVAAGGGAGTVLLGSSNDGLRVRYSSNQPICRTPLLRRLSVRGNVEGNQTQDNPPDMGSLEIYSTANFGAYQGQSTDAPIGPVYQHTNNLESSLGIYVPTCRHYPQRCIADENQIIQRTVLSEQTGEDFLYIGPKPYQVGECFKWDGGGQKVECVVGFHTGTRQPIINRTPRTVFASSLDGQYNVNGNGVMDHLDCAGANWTGEFIYGCTDNGNMGQEWWEQVIPGNDEEFSYQILTGIDNYPGNPTNYNPAANSDDGSCDYPDAITEGCTDPDALNYNPAATDDDGSCEYPVTGCTDQGNQNQTYWNENGYPESTGIDIYAVIAPGATNFNPDADEDDGSCEYITGCTDENAVNYNPEATLDDGSCDDPVPGCTDVNAINYNENANVPDGSCQYSGCMDPEADNFDDEAFFDNDEYESEAAQNEALCEYLGCTNPDSPNFDPQATQDDGSCLKPQQGCMNPDAVNYNENYNQPGQCHFEVPVCAIEKAENFVTDDIGGVVSYEEITSQIIPGQPTPNPLVQVIMEFMQANDDLAQLAITPWSQDNTSALGPGGEYFAWIPIADNTLCEMPPIPGCTDQSADNYNPEASEDDGSCEYTINVGVCNDRGHPDAIPLQTFEPGDTSYTNNEVLYQLIEDAITATNLEFGPQVTIQLVTANELCEKRPGCTDPDALNYDPLATVDDGSCRYPRRPKPNPCRTFATITPGSTPEEAMATAQGAQIGPNNGGRGHYCERCQQGSNANPQQNNFPVIVVNNTNSSIPGLALGNVFLPAVGESIGSTIQGPDGNNYVGLNMCNCCNVPQGCTDPDALNYDQSAHLDDGSCEYPVITACEALNNPLIDPNMCGKCTDANPEQEGSPFNDPNSQYWQNYNNMAVIFDTTCANGCCQEDGFPPTFNLNNWINNQGYVASGGVYTPFNPLEEQTIKRFQKLANIKRKK